MPQASYAFAVARIRAAEPTLLNRETIGRMLEGDAEDSMRALREAGYGDKPEATAEDCEALIEKERRKAAALLREVSPEPEVTDLFLLGTDVNNLKLLLKARLLGKKAGDTPLAAGGLYPGEALAAMVQAGEYRDLPTELSTALEGLEKALAQAKDPQRVSVTLDKAYAAYAAAVLKTHPDSPAAEYFAARSDFDNALTLLRLRAANAPLDAFRSALLPGGDIPFALLAGAWDQAVEAMAKSLCTGRAGNELAAGLLQVQQTGRIASLERARDDALFAILAAKRYETDSIGPLLGYFAAREQEARCVRLILTAKRNNLPPAIISERLREVYG